MTNQDKNQKHQSKLSCYMKTNAKKKVQKEETVASFQMTPDSSPSSLDQAELNSQLNHSENNVLETQGMENKMQSNGDKIRTENSDMAVATGNVAVLPPVADKQEESSKELVLPQEDEIKVADSKPEPCSNSLAMGKGDALRMRAGKNKTVKDNPTAKAVGEVQAVSPSAPKQKVMKLKNSTLKTDAVAPAIVSTKPATRRKKKTQPEAQQTNTITNYYPVRRSARQTKTEIEKERQHQLEEQILSHCEDGLEVKVFKDKGRGVVATKEFLKGDFVVEYAGELIDLDTARLREEKYSETPDVGCYMYYFTCASKPYCIDATPESKYLGRLINHSRDGNCCTRAVMVNRKPYLVLVASRDIQPGEELLYDYGDRRKEAVQQHPWLKL